MIQDKRDIEALRECIDELEREFNLGVLTQELCEETLKTIEEILGPEKPGRLLTLEEVEMLLQKRREAEESDLNGDRQ